MGAGGCDVGDVPSSRLYRVMKTCSDTKQFFVRPSTSIANDDSKAPKQIGFFQKGKFYSSMSIRALNHGQRGVIKLKEITENMGTGQGKIVARQTVKMAFHLLYVIGPCILKSWH